MESDVHLFCIGSDSKMEIVFCVWILTSMNIYAFMLFGVEKVIYMAIYWNDIAPKNE